MHSPNEIPQFLQPQSLNPIQTSDDLNSCLYLDQNTVILDSKEKETDLSLKIVRMSKDHFLEYFQPKNYSEEVQTENTHLKEKNRELKKQVQGLLEVFRSVNQNNGKTSETQAPHQSKGENEDVIKIEENIKEEEAEEATCDCIVCKSIDEGKIKVEDNEKDIVTEGSTAVRMIFRLKKQEDIVKEVSQKFEQVEEKYRELLKTLEQLEAAKLKADEKLVQAEDAKLACEERLAEVENKNQGLLKYVEELKRDKLNEKEVMEKSIKEHCDKSCETENRNRELLKELKEVKFTAETKLAQFEELKATKSIIEKKLTAIESKNQKLLESLEHLETAKLRADGKLAQLESRNQELVKTIEELREGAEDQRKARAALEKNLIQKNLELEGLAKEKEEISKQSEPELRKRRDSSLDEKKASDSETIYQNFERQLSSIRAKVADSLDQTWYVSGDKNNSINLNLKQLTESLPVLESGIIQLIEELESWKNLSISRKEEVENLQEILNDKEDKLSQSPVKEGIISGSTTASKNLNAKRNFDSVGSGFKKNSIYLRLDDDQIEKEQGDFFYNDVPTIKKLKKYE